ncbi:thiamine diphosphokinase [Sporolactobacillus sp. CQH2019]|uniref:thiamine diphosphokinase n=1 Tax=Sporolactobacillus sp. CQH2019 TaxID=3023512 RepID=UPI0023689D46|nr:thiamine diphosphokinase [Sporolactobacillus sp. CQH2019]MDD9147103.1 thiamine diphosphokinase [Sporolactobacillus sp. CQH2019]
MRIAIVAGGPRTLIPDLTSDFFKDCLWVGADHGTYILLENHLSPVRAFGDFDSLSDEERSEVFGAGIRLDTYPREKDKTDLELALDWALGRDPDECLILGATGGRLDHGLANVQMLLKGVDKKTKLILLDKKNCITLLTPGIYHVKRKHVYPYLSFLSLTEKVAGLTLRGVKYPLTEAELLLGSSLCISNEAEAEIFTISFSEGILLMMRCSD